MQRPSIAPAVALVLAAAAGALATSAEAQPRRGKGGYAYVTAQSRYSGATVSGPVREARNGRLEVRLPGGTWLECGRSCSETLRRETVDFWRDKGFPRGGGSDGPGYLSIGR
jgi:hypothetical protein